MFAAFSCIDLEKLLIMALRRYNQWIDGCTVAHLKPYGLKNNVRTGTFNSVT